MPKLITFHRILAGCEEGSGEAWRAFLADYAPIVAQLLSVYVPLAAEAREEFSRDSLQELAGNNCQRLRAFDHQAEREFLYDLRVFLLERGGSKLDPAQDAQDAPRPTLDSVRGILKDLPLVHQEILLVKLAGYSNHSVERFFRITPAVAQKGFERLQTSYSSILDRASDRCPWPAAWAEFSQAAGAAQTSDCPPLRQFVRILDGQYGWYEKEPTEEHIRNCAPCLVRWVALREIMYWRREAKACPPSQVEALLSSLSLRQEAKPRKSLLARIWS